MKKNRFVFGLLVIVSWSAWLYAQATIPNLVLNPTTVAFTASPDHAATAPLSGEALVTRYEGRYFTLDAAGNIPAGATPAFVVDYGKPTPGAGNTITLTNALGGMLPNTAYRLIVFAVGPGGEAESNASNPFGRETRSAPRPASSVVVR